MVKLNWDFLNSTWRGALGLRGGVSSGRDQATSDESLGVDRAVSDADIGRSRRLTRVRGAGGHRDR